MTIDRSVMAFAGAMAPLVVASLDIAGVSHEATGRVFVASDRALMIFGLGAPVNAATAAPPFARAMAVAAPPETVLYGSVAQVDGTTLWLRTRTDLVRVDLGAADSAGKSVTLVPGRAVEVVGHRQPDEAVRAGWLAYASEWPALWKADE